MQRERERERELVHAYFNSTIKTKISLEDSLDTDLFKKFLIGLITGLMKEVHESVDGEYINDSIHSLLSGSSYVELPDKLRNSKKCLINTKNDDNKCFLWCNIRYLNPLKTHPERVDREMVNGLDSGDIKFHVSKKGYSRIEKKNNIAISVFGYENGLVYPIYVSDEKFEPCMDFLSVKDDSSHIISISNILTNLYPI